MKDCNSHGEVEAFKDLTNVEFTGNELVLLRKGPSYALHSASPDHLALNTASDHLALNTAWITCSMPPKNWRRRLERCDEREL